MVGSLVGRGFTKCAEVYLACLLVVWFFVVVCTIVSHVKLVTKMVNKIPRPRFKVGYSCLALQVLKLLFHPQVYLHNFKTKPHYSSIIRLLKCQNVKQHKS